MARLGYTIINNEPITPTRYGLLSPAVTVVEDSSLHWEGGFNYEITDYVDITNISSESNTVSSVIFATDIDVNRRKEYLPFVIQSSVQASTMGTNPEELKKKAVEALKAATQKALEREFWAGTITKALITAGDTGLENRYLAATTATDVTPTPGTAIKPLHGLALLESSLGSSGFGEVGVVHATRSGATSIGLGLCHEEDVLLTKLGTKVVAGSGYLGTGPDGNAPSGSKTWLYATGPVSVRLGSIEVYQDRVQSAIDTSVNTITYTANRIVAPSWSNKAHYGVLIDLSLTYS